MSDAASDAELFDATAPGAQEAFQRRAEPYRREIQVHCYRMLGSLQDAEDLTQETFLRAWRGVTRYEGRASFRNWLYRIATNVCLDALAKRAAISRVLPQTVAPPTDATPDGGPPLEIPWLEPYPDAWLEGIPDGALGPDARYELRESVQLAFVAAIQLLPPRQRLVLLLRDVLGWSASESAALLDTTVVSANSALQRARATLGKQFPAGEPESLPMPDEQQRALLDRFVRTWEAADVDGLVALLREDADFSMPPWPHWYHGLAAIRMFLAWLWRARAIPGIHPGMVYRLVPTSANHQPACAIYRCDDTGTLWYGHGIDVLTVRDGKISQITTFRDPRLVAAFGLPMVLSAPQEPLT